MKTSYNETEKEKHISLLPIENQDQMRRLWALNAREEVTAWRKPSPALHWLPLSNTALICLCPDLICGGK